MGNLMQYGKYDPKIAQTEREMSGGTSSILKLDGKKTLRFLPPSIGKNSPFQLVFSHYIKFPTSEQAVSFACPRVMVKKACPACEQADKLAGSPNPGDQKRATELQSRPRFYANVIDRANPEKGPQVIVFPKTVHKELVELLEDPDWGDFTSPYGLEDIRKMKDIPASDRPSPGYDITINRTGTTMSDTRYSVKPKKETSPLSEDQAEAQDWIDAQVDLAKYAVLLDYNRILEKLAEASGVSMPPGRQARNVADEDD